MAVSVNQLNKASHTRYQVLYRQSAHRWL